MSFHQRSFSEQPQPLRPQQSPSFNNNYNNVNINNNIIVRVDGLAEAAGKESSGGEILHSDSQQSLDRLFNPSSMQATVPLKNRNLPASFFNPSWKTIKDEQNEPKGNSTSASLHSRSTSFDYSHNNPNHGPTNLHMRTQSTLAPMTGFMSQGWNQSNSTSATQAGMISSSGTAGNAPVSHVQQTQLSQPPPPQQQPPNAASEQIQPNRIQQPHPIPQPRGIHYRNYSSPAFMSEANPQVGQPFVSGYNNYNRAGPDPTRVSGQNDFGASSTGFNNASTISYSGYNPQQIETAQGAFLSASSSDYFSSGSTSDLSSSTNPVNTATNPPNKEPSTHRISDRTNQQVFYTPYQGRQCDRSPLPSITQGSDSSYEYQSFSTPARKVSYQADYFLSSTQHSVDSRPQVHIPTACYAEPFIPEATMNDTSYVSTTTDYRDPTNQDCATPITTEDMLF